MENNILTTTPLAFAWNETYGQYSEDIANKIINFEKRQKLRFRSVLDICCGSGNLLDIMSKNNKLCYGTETLDDFILYNQNKSTNIKVFQSNNILDFDKIKTFDLITCTNCVLNNLNNLLLWEEFFEKVYSNLNDGGVLFFDFYTQTKLDNWNENIYKETENFDQIKSVKVNPEALNSSKINDTFYIKSSSEEANKYKKSEFSQTIYAFKNEQIIDAIIKSKFRYLIPVDANLKPIKSLNDLKTAYIIAIKRET